MSLRHRAQEWLADRVRWVQYPDIRLVGERRVFRPHFVHRMPFGKRMDLLLFSLAGLCVALLLLCAIGFVAFSVLLG